jgi:formylglycine-generating enzyme required for sulfatase activity
MRAALVSLVLLGACGDLPPPGQIILHLDTDAPLPALFDRVRVEVYLPGEAKPCAGCTHDFALDSERVVSGRASLGIAQTPGRSGYRVRVRMFRGVAVHDGEPNADSTVDVTAALPSAPLEGIAACSIFLRTDDVARPVGSLDAPVAVTPGAVTTGHAGTWPGARRTSCTGAPEEGEACVPGGAYWMGNPRVVYGSGPEGGAANIQRLVILSPFFLDVHEVTVGRLKAIGAGTNGITPWTGKTNGNAFEDWCTFTAKSDHDALPVNCISWHAARSHCNARGGDLPTEAQWEYTASHMDGSLYVWGDDDPTCADGIYARAGVGQSFGYSGECWDGHAFGGPFDPERERVDRDALAVSSGAILDLAGNLSEWTLDDWEPQDGACWGSGVLRDPSCVTDAPKTSATRGASWTDGPIALHASWRSPYPRTTKIIQTGFRCARPGVP